MSGEIAISAPPKGVQDRIGELITRGQALFSNNYPCLEDPIPDSRDFKMRLKIASSYTLPRLPNELSQPSALSISDQNKRGGGPLLLTSGFPNAPTDRSSGAATADASSSNSGRIVQYAGGVGGPSRSSTALVARRPTPKVPVPEWHAPWELSAVVSGHLGWVRCVAFDPSNEWFVTGSADRTIKIWDLAKCCAGAEGGLKLTLTGHISAVRGLAVSSRSPYLFSAGEDKQIKCWDLEYNKVIRHYHGHLSGIMCLGLHPTLDLLVTAGRDSVARVWDIRSKHQIHVLAGHSAAVGSMIMNSVDPQITTASYDSTIKLWDLAAGKCMTTLTQHKKSVRNIVKSPRESTFASAGADNIKKWQCRDGRFLMNFSGHNSVVNCMAANDEGILVSAGDNGSINFWDYETGYCFQRTQTIAQPGSLDAEAGVFAMTFDLSGSRLITCEADKSIKIWKENSEATEDSHPVDMDSWSKQCLALKRY